jgi:hypothetical protein|tara:strand:- start:1234 stop:1419 length:186 start_codon:yes stop_codon:yes gene_type:complete
MACTTMKYGKKFFENKNNVIKTKKVSFANGTVFHHNHKINEPKNDFKHKINQQENKCCSLQ